MHHAAAADTPADAPMDRGEYVARVGNCVACHSVPDAPAFSGGLKMATPLGAIYATNITPDKFTGIGDYSLEDFDRAMRLGIAKDGHRLYPAMPYPSYAKMSEQDMKALYDFIMKSVPAANVANKPSEIPFPLNMRWPLAIWNALFVDDARYQAKAEQSAQWNRGAYLVQGLGHCGACHTPRGLAFNEKGYSEASGKFLMGAELDNWSAPNLRQDVNTGLGAWAPEDTVEFLQAGHNRFGTAFGTMTEVINNSTQYMTDGDIEAVATYLHSLPGAREKDNNPFKYDPTIEQKLKARQYDVPGALVYAQQCMTCHSPDGKGFAPYLPPLAGNPVIQDPLPASLINIVLNSSSMVVVDGMPDAYRMPQYRVLLNDQEIADVVSFIRSSWGNQASPVAAQEVAKMREETDPAGDRVHILRMK
ncbi:MAG: cytochrome c [Pseudomonadota bacterium]|nr:cytochrome c [Pseudomonadota bacterium]